MAESVKNIDNSERMNELTKEEIQLVKDSIDLLLVDIKNSEEDNERYDKLIKNKLIQ
jgi:hypothetical protein